MMTAKIVKDNTRGRRDPETTVPTPKPRPPVAPTEKPVDYSKAFDSKDKLPKKKSRGRGPSPHYIGMIKHFLATGENELPINIDEFRKIVGKSSLKRESVRQGFRNNLQNATDSTGTSLWDLVKVSIIADEEFPLDHERATITLQRRNPKSGKND